MRRIEGNIRRKVIDQVQLPIEGVGRQATPIEGESEADRARPTKRIEEKTGIFITRRHWEKEKRKRPAKSFDRIEKAELVEVGPQPSTGERKGPLVLTAIILPGPTATNYFVYPICCGLFFS